MDVFMLVYNRTSGGAPHSHLEVFSPTRASLNISDTFGEITVAVETRRHEAFRLVTNGDIAGTKNNFIWARG